MADYLAVDCSSWLQQRGISQAEALEVQRLSERLEDLPLGRALWNALRGMGGCPNGSNNPAHPCHQQWFEILMRDLAPSPAEASPASWREDLSLWGAMLKLLLSDPDEQVAWSRLKQEAASPISVSRRAQSITKRVAVFDESYRNAKQHTPTCPQSGLSRNEVEAAIYAWHLVNLAAQEARETPPGKAAGKGRGTPPGKPPPPKAPPALSRQNNVTAEEEKRATMFSNPTTSPLMTRIIRHVDTHLRLHGKSNDAALRAQLIQNPLVFHPGLFSETEQKKGSLDHLRGEAEVTVTAVARLAWVLAARTCSPVITTVGYALKCATELVINLHPPPSGPLVPEGYQVYVVDPGKSEPMAVPTVEETRAQSLQILNRDPLRFASVAQFMEKLTGDASDIRKKDIRSRLIFESTANATPPLTCQAHMGNHNAPLLSWDAFLQHVLTRLDKLLNPDAPTRESKDAMRRAQGETNGRSTKDVARPTGTQAAAPPKCPLPPSITHQDLTLGAVTLSKLQRGHSGVSLGGFLSRALRGLEASVSRSKCAENIRTMTTNPEKGRLEVSQEMLRVCKETTAFCTQALIALNASSSQPATDDLSGLMEDLELWGAALKVGLKSPVSIETLEREARNQPMVFNDFSEVIELDRAYGQELGRGCSPSAGFLTAAVRRHAAPAYRAVVRVLDILAAALNNLIHSEEAGTLSHPGPPPEGRPAGAQATPAQSPSLPEQIQGQARLPLRGLQPLKAYAQMRGGDVGAPLPEGGGPAIAPAGLTQSPSLQEQSQGQAGLPLEGALPHAPHAQGRTTTAPARPPAVAHCTADVKQTCLRSCSVRPECQKLAGGT